MSPRFVRRDATYRVRLLPVVLLAALSGCSGGAGTVTGKVTLSGAASVTSGVVVFTAADGVPFSALIDGNGNYRLTKLPEGEMKISVVNSMMRPGSGPVKNPDAPPPVSANPAIPKRYENPDNGLRYTVQGGSQIHDIDLRP